MRCHICDKALSAPNYSSDHEEYDPCETCLSVIADTVGSFGDRPAAAEDELEAESPLLDPLLRELIEDLFAPG